MLVVDDGADLQVLRLARRDARRLPPAEAGVETVAALARQGLQVVRLTLGDAAAEMAALRAMQVAAERLA